MRRGMLSRHRSANPSTAEPCQKNGIWGATQTAGNDIVRASTAHRIQLQRSLPHCAPCACSSMQAAA